MRLSSLFIRIFAPVYCRLVGFLAYGPWGPLHQIFIRIFQRMYKVQWAETQDFKTLGDFFLRKVPLRISNSPLISPAEAEIVDGPQRVSVPIQLSIKGLDYAWKDFFELNLASMPQAVFWNFYLAPHNYHWVHAPCDGSNLEAFYHEGHLYPVNSWGRKMAPYLYSINERISFRWKHPQFGQVMMICVGAMAVSRLRSVKGPVVANQWVKLSDDVKKAEEILAFELGSTVLLILENPPSSLNQKTVVSVGDGL